MSKFVFVTGGFGGSGVARLVSLGSFEHGRRCRYVVSGHAQSALIGDRAGFQHAVIDRPWRAEAQEKVETLLAETADDLDVVIDLHAAVIGESTSLLARANLIVVPVRQWREEIDAAVGVCARISDLLVARGLEDRHSRPWLLPLGWTSVPRAVRDINSRCDAAAEKASDFQRPRIIPWSVLQLSWGLQDMLVDPQMMFDVPAVTTMPATLAKILSAIAANPTGALPNSEALFERLDNVDPKSFFGDHRTDGQRLIELGEDIDGLEENRWPTPAELASAPAIHNWKKVTWSPNFVLSGMVVGHPRLRDGPVRTSIVYYWDPQNRFVRTLSRYYKLGRPEPAEEGEH